MIDNFIVEDIKISGANSFNPIDYKLMTYTPAVPYKNSANIKITLG